MPAAKAGVDSRPVGSACSASPSASRSTGRAQPAKPLKLTLLAVEYQPEAAGAIPALGQRKRRASACGSRAGLCIAAAPEPFVQFQIARNVLVALDGAGVPPPATLAHAGQRRAVDQYQQAGTAAVRVAGSCMATSPDGAEQGLQCWLQCGDRRAPPDTSVAAGSGPTARWR